MKRKNIGFIIGTLIFAINFITIFSGCSMKSKFQGVWELKTSNEYQNGVLVNPKTYPYKNGDITIYKYWCFTKSGLCYKATRIEGGKEPGLTRGPAYSYTVDGNKLIIAAGEEGSFSFNKDSLTITDEYTKTKNGVKTAYKFVSVWQKVKSPSVKDIENAKR
ncbi:hypothetical protein [Treponema pedis]|nr:hypothetical protein [Treponema pedis]